MSSDAFEQFAENFGCWITDHGAEGAHGGHITDGSWPAIIHLPTLEAGIRDLIIEARALVAAETIVQLDHAAEVAPDPITTAIVSRALEPVRAELAEIAAPDGECAMCGHVGQPEYRHDTTDHVRGPLQQLQRRMAAVETALGLL